MGYYIEIKKVNLLFDKTQQEQIFKRWMNPQMTGDFYKDTAAEKFKESFVTAQCKTTKDILNSMNFRYEETKNGLKITAYHAKMRSQDDLFEQIAHIITPGNFITFRGEDGAFFGWFFNGDLIHYESNKELKELQKPFDLKKKLDKELPQKEATTKMKVKV